ncbi:MAG: orotate phosphoribosyltransferase [Bacteroidales bacterium]|nr:orotate phosphoribosyltransferase [Bacteroidales bacterium]
MKISVKLASYLLQSKAIIIDPANPFTWASGWTSPIYCDNRKTLSYPEIRDFIRDSFIREIQASFVQPDIIAGVATGAIAHAALVAGKMELPLIYVRSSQKSHGMANLIEGDVSVGKTVVVIEDLVSTGGSSLNAVSALREAGMNVLGMASIFTYGFPQAVENFKQADIELVSLGNYHDLIEQAVHTGYIQPEFLETLDGWLKDPARWTSKS